MIGIYLIRNKTNNHKYVGQSKDIKKRIISHRCISHEKNIPLKKAYNKYGLDNFEFKVLEECSIEELDNKEIEWIKKIKPEYNLTSGGNGSPSHNVSEETRKVLSEKSKNQWKTMSEETKNKILSNLKPPKVGHYVSEKTKEKLRQCNLGKKQSQETIEKRKQTFIKMKENGYVQTNGNHRKKVICIETNEIFNSLKDAQSKYNLTSLCRHLKGKQKSCGGKHFKYYQEDSSVTTNDDECNRVG